MKSVKKLGNAEMGSLISRLELQNLRAEADFIDVPELRSDFRIRQEAYDAKLDVLANLLVLVKTARFRRSQVDVDRSVGSQLQDVMNARVDKERSFNLWWRGTQRLQHLRGMIKTAEEELATLVELEQKAREECHAPIVELARVWTSCRVDVSDG